MKRRLFFVISLMRYGLAAIFYFFLAGACDRGGTAPREHANPFRDTVAIMPLGNSITEASDGDASYRYWLWHMLADSAYPVNFVGSMNGVLGGEPAYTDFDMDHEGHFGWTTGEIRDSIGVWARLNPPDIVLIHAGTNDIGDTAAAIAARCGHIIDSLRAANSSVIVLLGRIIPLIWAMYADDILAFNLALDSLATALHTHNAPVITVDHFTGFDAETDCYDGVHPNEAGEKKMAQRWFATLDSIFRARGFSLP